MKKSKKKSIKKKPIKKKPVKKKLVKKRAVQKQERKISSASKSTILKIIRFQDKLKPNFNFNFLDNIKKFINIFFQKISDSIEDYNVIKEEEQRRL